MFFKIYFFPFHCNKFVQCSYGNILSNLFSSVFVKLLYFMTRSEIILWQKSTENEEHEADISRENSLGVISREYGVYEIVLVDF